jgi:hypothetical protein
VQPLAQRLHLRLHVFHLRSQLVLQYRRRDRDKPRG